MRSAQRVLMIVAAIAMVVAATAIPAHAGSEGTLLARINASRAAAGRPPVEVYWDLTDDARAHTNAMVAAGSIFHNPSLASVTSVWDALGENVGVSLDADSLHDAFMASSGHRANILGDYNYVGIGTAVDADGFLWATVVFMKAAPGLNSGGETTTSVTTATTTTTTTATTTTTTTSPSEPDPPGTTTTTVANDEEPDGPVGVPKREPTTGGAPRPADSHTSGLTESEVPSPGGGLGKPDGLPALAI